MMMLVSLLFSPWLKNVNEYIEIKVHNVNKFLLTVQFIANTYKLKDTLFLLGLKEFKNFGGRSSKNPGDDILMLGIYEMFISTNVCLPPD